MVEERQVCNWLVTLAKRSSHHSQEPTFSAVTRRMGEGEQGPKLSTNKPRKEQLKQFRRQHKSNHFSSAMPTNSAAPPPPPPKVPFVRRYKFIWPMLLAVNLAVGAYLFMRPKEKDTGVEEEDTSSISTKDATARDVETPVSSLTNPVIKREPIPEDQQRDLFKWILEEKRKVKPKDAEEKRRIDEEKALLKKYLGAKSIPSF